MMNIVQRRLQNIGLQLKTGRHSQIKASTAQNIFSMARQAAAFSTAEGAPLPYNRFHAGIAMNPHPAKRDKGGEDAATITESFIALADGVGGWAESGVDPAKYSRALCKNIQGLIMYDSEKFMCNPRQLCVEAAKLTKDMGSSTCVIASIDKEAPVLYTSNLGDSGYMLLRKTEEGVTILFRSKEQTHGFNFPFQIGTGGDDPVKAD